MKNLYKERNFDNHLDTLCFNDDVFDYSASNYMYDMNRGVTHMILKDSKGNERVVSDVEIAMSDSPEITSLFPDEYRQRLRASLMSKSSVTDRPVVTDDELIKLNIPNGLERDELATALKARSSDFHNRAVREVRLHESSGSGEPPSAAPSAAPAE